MIPIVINRSKDAGGSPPSVSIVALAILLLSLALGAALMAALGHPAPLIVMLLVGIVGMQSPRIAQQWERAVILRLGRYTGLRGPGLFWIVPFVLKKKNVTDVLCAE